MRKNRLLNSGEAARRLGVTPKALRLYEDHGLLAPDRTPSGWRLYGSREIERAKDIISLRKLGLRLTDIARLLADDACRETVLAEHRVILEAKMLELGRALRTIGPDGRAPSPSRSRENRKASPAVSFDLPWPWGGERFELPETGPLTFITGPLGSGKTRLAMKLAESIPGCCLLGPDRLDASGMSYGARLERDPPLLDSAGGTVRTLVAAGATPSPALTALVAALVIHRADPMVIDMVEQGLDRPSQLALAGWLRRCAGETAPRWLMTRSSAILDLAAAESGETIIYCPANHNPPMIVWPDPLCPGYEAVATCLASPEVRARTAGVMASRAGYGPSTLGDSRETFC